MMNESHEAWCKAYSFLREGETLTSVEALVVLMLTGANCCHLFKPDHPSKVSLLSLKQTRGLEVVHFPSKALEGDNLYFFTVVLQYSTVTF